jgi:hypothetical protein
MTAILKLFIFSMTFAGYLKTGREYPMTKAMIFPGGTGFAFWQRQSGFGHK